jgi:hypothetical protein
MCTFVNRGHNKAWRLMPQSYDEIAVVAKVRWLVRMIVLFQPIGAGVLMPAGPAAVDRVGNNSRVIGQAPQLSIDRKFLHHASHRGGSYVDRNQEVIEAHIH